MKRENFIYGLNACGVTYNNGKTLYEHDELVKCFEDLGLFEQEPCEDAISRQAVLNILFKYTLGESRIAEELKDLPLVNPQESRWIPVSERLPEEDKAVIASTEYGVYPEAKYTKEYGWEWAYESGADYWRKLEGVTAWMPLPKPYESQESEDKE